MVFSYSSGSFLSKAIKRTKLLSGGYRTLPILKSALFKRLDIKCFEKASTLPKDKKEI